MNTVHRNNTYIEQCILLNAKLWQVQFQQALPCTMLKRVNTSSMMHAWPKWKPIARKTNYTDKNVQVMINLPLLLQITYPDKGQKCPPWSIHTPCWGILQITSC